MLKPFLILFVAGYVHAITDKEAKAEFVKLVMTCMKTNPVEMSEVMNLQKLIAPEKQETKCLLACAYKLDEVMTQDGRYNVEKANKKAELMKEGDDKRLENARKMVEICSQVNNVEVSDGEKGCERAGLMFKCFTENAPKLGFKA